MLKLSTKGLYGIKALYELARNYGGEPLNIREISRRHKLPMPFLEKVLHRLKKSGLVTSKRGVHGGYQLSHHPKDVTLGDAIRALEGPIALCDCLQHTESTKIHQRITNCVTSEIYIKLSKILEDSFDSITFSDFSEKKPETHFTVVCKD